MKVLRNLRLHHVLIAGSVAVSVVFTTIFTAVVETKSRTDVNALISAQLVEANRTANDRIQRGINLRVRDLGFASSFITAMGSPYDTAVARNWLENLRASNNNYAWIGVVGADGIVDVSTSGFLEGTPLADSFNMSSGTNLPHLSVVTPTRELDPLFFTKESANFIQITADITNAIDISEGQIVAFVYLDYIGSLTRPIDYDSAVEQFAVLPNGIAWTGTDVPELTLVEKDQLAILRAQNTTKLVSWSDGLKYLTNTYVPAEATLLGDLEWLLVSRYPEDIAFAPAWSIRNYIIWAGIIIALLSSVGITMVAHRLSHPLRKIAQAVDADDDELHIRDLSPTTWSYEMNAIIASLKDKVHGLISARDSALEESEVKQALVMEINHRVHNNLQTHLSLLRVQANNQLLEPVCKDTMNNMVNRVQAHGEMYKLIYDQEDFRRVSILELVEKVVESHKNIYVTKCIQVDYQVDDALVELQTAVPLGMILVELLSNSFRHAYVPLTPNEDRLVLITLKKIDDNWELSVKDWGQGFDPKIKTTGVGNQIIRGFLFQLRGRRDDVANTVGSHVTITIPASTIGKTSKA